MSEPTSKLRALLPWALALALGLGLSLERLSDVAAHPGAVLVGDWTHPDCLGNHWLLVWVAEQLEAGQGLLHNDRYYWPVGDAPWLAGNGSEGLLYLPFHALLGWPVGVGVLMLLVLVGNTLAGYALGRAAGGGPYGALITAAAAGSLTYVVQEMGSGRFTQADITWLTLGLAGLFALREGARWPVAIGTGLAMGLAAALYWYHGLFLALAAGVVVATRLLHRERLPWPQLLGAAAVGLAIALPVLAIYLGNWELIPGTGVEEPFPHPEAIGDSLRVELPIGVDDGRMVSQAVSLPVLLLALLALGRRLLRFSDRPGADAALIGVTAIFFALALGVNGPLYEPLHGLAAPLRRFWWPHRYIVVAQLSLAALAARGVAVVPLRARSLVALALALGVSPALRLAGEPVRIHQSAVKLPPELYVQISALPGEVLLSLPFSPQLASTQTPLIYQLYHQKRMLNGHAPWVDRVRPPAWDRMIAENSFLAGLAAYERAEPGWPGPDGVWRFEAADLQRLIDEGLAVIVVDMEHFPLRARPLVEGLRATFDALFGSPAVRDKRAWAWETSGWTGEGEVEPPPWSWPPGLRPGSGTQSVNALRSASPTFDPDSDIGRAAAPPR
ncbi:MAG: hypothetical protein H6740_13495 [Alphaproteobacteria bacterium]|nr:hypothetical protein [Alphaproteobacteria bacterium]